MIQANNPLWAQGLYKPNRYKILYGGRGGGKSYAIADALLIIGASKQCRVLCAREFQSSIKDSVLRLLEDRINALGLDDFYEVQRDQILGANGTLFVFRGLRLNIASIKSMAGISHVWVEEAQTVSEESWRVLIPTIREENSEIWISLNPLKKEDATSQRFLLNTPYNAYKRKVNYSDNPNFPKTLDDERKQDRERLDAGTYAWIWEGQYLQNSKSQILSDKLLVEEFKSQQGWQGPYFGVDWGFSADPTGGVKCWINDDNLYIEYDAAKVGLELDDTAEYLKAKLPDIEKYTARADSARPETISYLRRFGMPRIEGVKKWGGSVEDGIMHLRSYKNIIVHPRCTDTINEMRLYSYKTDRLTGDVLPDIIDANNHNIDAIRYALQPLIKQSKQVLIA